MQLTLFPPAKINLGLWLHSRRSDGFHELSTLFHEIPLKDSLVFELSDQKEFICEAFPGPDNLCLRAWTELEAKLGRELKAKVSLHKNIPAEAGLGGASSDASFLLKGLNDLHELKLSAAELEELAALFGSDTAFFIEAGCQLGEGRGEELRPLETSLNCKLLLAVPDFGCSTPAVFKALDSKFSDKKNQIKDLEMALKTGKLSEIRPKISNDLKSAAQKTVPELENFMNLISSQFDLPCHLSGSGSSCFVLSETELEKPETFEGRYLALFDMHKQQILWEIRS